ncbi:MAG: FIST C-terminal domain-containing protein [Candidatus Pacebacteria bacterium]|nr:FIST C-terminal domain-containing protein [Candidatus Paceibacterota bacterium]
MIRTEQKLWTKDSGWENLDDKKLDAAPQLVFAFAARVLVEDQKIFQQIRNFYPGAYIIMCSTAGEILDTAVRDDSVALTAVHFEKSVVRFSETTIENVEDSLNVGKRLAEFLPVEGLVHAMVFCDGLNVNGTLLVKGVNDNLPPNVSVTGGLVGDGSDFKKTVVGRDGPGQSNKVVLLGFYGPTLKVGYGSLGGWDVYGDSHTLTKSNGNVLYEIDGKPALSVYKQILGEEQAKQLPSSALLFPLRLETEDQVHNEVVRTILGVNEADQSMTFAGDMPQGARAHFMQANFDRLIDGASGAGKLSLAALGTDHPQLAILVSCIGRKLVLKERSTDEVKAVRSVLGAETAISGFYSYGELCPTAASGKQCLLHNQTMTITAFRED